jgi:hypothetical protein
MFIKNGAYYDISNRNIHKSEMVNTWYILIFWLHTSFVEEVSIYQIWGGTCCPKKQEVHVIQIAWDLHVVSSWSYRRPYVVSIVKSPALASCRLHRRQHVVEPPLAACRRRRAAAGHLYSPPSTTCCHRHRDEPRRRSWMVVAAMVRFY